MSTRYRFRLASVLRLRRAEYEQSEEQLARANAALRALIARRDEEGRRCATVGMAPVSQSRDDFFAQQSASGLAAASLLRVEAAVNVAAAEAALARLAWSSARQRLEALERLDARRREEWMIEQGRAQANELDELANAAFLRERQELVTAR